MTTIFQDRELAALMTEELRFTISGREISVDDADMGFIVDWVGRNLNPEDVFKDNDLRDWAFRNRFVEA